MPTNENMEQNERINPEILESLGISQPAYEEILSMVGHVPTIDQLSTLLAMWNTSGNKQSLIAWLKGQPHAVERHDYIVNDDEPESKEIKEPRVKECIDIAISLTSSLRQLPPLPSLAHFAHRGDAIYMVGDVSSYISNSTYARQHLHLVDNPIKMNDDETRDYLNLILSALHGNGTIISICPVAEGGLFGTLLRCAAPAGLGFDILACREVRLDAFLFGEQGVRFIVTLDEPHEDFFLMKLTEARINCCFLGRCTKQRILVDDMDFGPLSRFSE